MSVQSIARSSLALAVAHTLQRFWRTMTHTNDPFPEGLFYQLGISMMVSAVLLIFAAIKEYSRLYVKEVFLYKKVGFIAHEFLVFAVHDKEATYKNKPLVYIRIERFGVRAKNGSASVSAPEGSSKASKARDSEGLLTSLKRNSQGSLLSSSTSSSDSLSSVSVAKISEDRFLMAENIEDLLYEGAVAEYECSIEFAEPVDPMKLLVLASTLSDVAPRYHPLKENCYFFCSSVLDLSEHLLGGTRKLLAKLSKAGHAGHRIPLPFLLGDDISEYRKLVEEAKKAYGTKWDEFKQRRETAEQLKQEIAKREESERKAAEALKRERAADEAREVSESKAAQDRVARDESEGKAAEAAEALKQERAARDDTERKAARDRVARDESEGKAAEALKRERAANEAREVSESKAARDRVARDESEGKAAEAAEALKQERAARDDTERKAAEAAEALKQERAAREAREQRIFELEAALNAAKIASPSAGAGSGRSEAAGGIIPLPIPKQRIGFFRK